MSSKTSNILDKCSNNRETLSYKPPVRAGLFEPFIDVWKAAQHGLHTTA